MNTINKQLLIALAIFSISATNPAKDTYALSKGYSVTIHGTSNLHSWDETVGNVNGTCLVNWKVDKSFNLDNLMIKMEVRSIQSDGGFIMNSNTYKALKADAFPEIIFALEEPVYKIYETPDFTINAKGRLTIAGVSKSMNMQIRVIMHEQGKLEFQGSLTIKMTDFDVVPPVALFGRLKTGDEITIHFNTAFIISNPT